jgi:hypothetical protein
VPRTDADCNQDGEQVGAELFSGSLRTGRVTSITAAPWRCDGYPPRKFVNQEHDGDWLRRVRYVGRHRRPEAR